MSLRSFQHRPLWHSSICLLTQPEPVCAHLLFGAWQGFRLCPGLRLEKHRSSTGAEIGLHLYCDHGDYAPPVSAAFQMPRYSPKSAAKDEPSAFSLTYNFEQSPPFHGAADIFGVGPITSIERLATFFVDGKLQLSVTVTEVDGVPLGAAGGRGTSSSGKLLRHTYVSSKHVTCSSHLRAH